MVAAQMQKNKYIAFKIIKNIYNISPVALYEFTETNFNRSLIIYI